MHQESKVKELINFLIHLRERDFFSGSTYFFGGNVKGKQFFWGQKGSYVDGNWT